MRQLISLSQLPSGCSPRGVAVGPGSTATSKAHAVAPATAIAASSTTDGDASPYLPATAAGAESKAAGGPTIWVICTVTGPAVTVQPPTRLLTTAPGASGNRTTAR